MSTDLTGLNINLDTSKIEKSIQEMTSVIKDALNEINNSIAEFNESGNSLGNTIANVSGVIGTFSSVMALLASQSDVAGTILLNIKNIFALLQGPIGIATLALINATNAQIEADRLESELSDIKMQKKAKEESVHVSNNYNLDMYIPYALECLILLNA